ncbi:hypothetical protein [Falsiroseomonas ponticola]|uniref:hypothetical protein n=1 Tax=Falsiroseomonas ponticola TaxID=2786951 RepID=UPI0019331EB1|nr:hypothetical protein [Roseomonas ponticola]
MKGIVLLAIAMALASAAPAVAQTYRQQLVGRAGHAAIIRVFENGVFQRCAATNGQAGALLRIAFTRDRAFSLSVPASASAQAPHVLTLVLAAGGRRDLAGAASNDRAWAEIDARTVEALVASSGPLVIQYGRHRYSWDTGAPMRDILLALQACTNRALGQR